MGYLSDITYEIWSSNDFRGIGSQKFSQLSEFSSKLEKVERDIM